MEECGAHSAERTINDVNDERMRTTFRREEDAPPGRTIPANNIPANDIQDAPPGTVDGPIPVVPADVDVVVKVSHIQDSLHHQLLDGDPSLVDQIQWLIVFCEKEEGASEQNEGGIVESSSLISKHNLENVLSVAGVKPQAVHSALVTLLLSLLSSCYSSDEESYSQSIEGKVKKNQKPNCGNININKLGGRRRRTGLFLTTPPSDNVSELPPSCIVAGSPPSLADLWSDGRLPPLSSLLSSSTSLLPPRLLLAISITTLDEAVGALLLKQLKGDFKVAATSSCATTTATISGLMPSTGKSSTGRDVASDHNCTDYHLEEESRSTWRRCSARFHAAWSICEKIPLIIATTLTSRPQHHQLEEMKGEDLGRREKNLQLGHLGCCRLRDREKRTPREGHQQPQPPLVILCGGTSGCGKSTLSALVSARLGIKNVVSTDSMRELLRQQVQQAGKELEYPELFTSTYKGHEANFSKGAARALEEEQAYLAVAVNSALKLQSATCAQAAAQPATTTTYKERLLATYLAQCQLILKVVDWVIKDALAKGQSVLIEGVHLLPSYMAAKALQLSTPTTTSTIDLRRGSGGPPTQRGPTNPTPSVAPTAVVVPLLIYMRKEGKHKERLAVRGKAMVGRNDNRRRGVDGGVASGDVPREENPYLQHFEGIRVIQGYLLEQCLDLGLFLVSNTNVDRSINRIHCYAIQVVDQWRSSAQGDDEVGDVDSGVLDSRCDVGSSRSSEDLYHQKKYQPPRSLLPHTEPSSVVSVLETRLQCRLDFQRHSVWKVAVQSLDTTQALAKIELKKKEKLQKARSSVRGPRQEGGATTRKYSCGEEEPYDADADAGGGGGTASSTASTPVKQKRNQHGDILLDLHEGRSEDQGVDSSSSEAPLVVFSSTPLEIPATPSFRTGSPMHLGGPPLLPTRTRSFLPTTCSTLHSTDDEEASLLASEDEVHRYH